MESRRTLRLDLFLALLLGSGTVAYLAALPRGAVGVDEATYLKEALRLLRGEVIYRDVFDPTTPGWMYVMAALFRLFGATFATARVAAAVIQAATALAVFATCRTAGVRREIAFALAVVCVLSAEVNYPLASQHWLATLLSAATLLAYVRYGHTHAGVFATGMLVGLLISVHQQRGISIGFGAATFLACDALLQRHHGVAPTRALAQRALALASGVLAIVGPMLALLVWQAGFNPVWRALVVFPLVEYRQSMRCPWGFERNPDYLPAQVLKLLPVVLALTAARLAVLYYNRSQSCRHAQESVIPAQAGIQADDLRSQFRRGPILPDDAPRTVGVDEETNHLDSGLRRNDVGLRTMMVLGLHCAASILSIWYFPDRIHIAFIVPSFAVLIGEHIEWALRAGANLSPNPITPNPVTPFLPRNVALGYLLAFALVVPTLVLARDHFNERWRTLDHPYNGPFGRIDLPNRESVELYTQLDRLLRDVPGRTLYCYQMAAYACLFVDGRNPTRFELLVDHYNSQAQIAEVTHMLTLKDVPYVVALPAAIHPNEPIAAFIRRNYEQLGDGGAGAKYIWRRKSELSQGVD